MKVKGLPNVLNTILRDLPKHDCDFDYVIAYDKYEKSIRLCLSSKDVLPHEHIVGSKRDKTSVKSMAMNIQVIEIQPITF